jgi:hypothetical protein
MAEVDEKTFDILVSDIGEMRFVVRPPLPFLAEGFRIRDGEMEVFGGGRVMWKTITEDLRDEGAELDQAFLMEFDWQGGQTVRETDLMKEE